MAVNKESNSFTFGFAIALVVVIGVVLAALSEGLKPYKEKNVRVKKQLDILSAMMDVEKEGITRENAEVEFKKYVNLDNAIILDYKGNVKKGKEGKDAFDIDIKKEYRDKTLSEEDKNYPLFIAKDKSDNKSCLLYTSPSPRD